MRQEVLLLTTAAIVAPLVFASVTSAQFHERFDLENCLPTSGIGCVSVYGPYSTSSTSLIATVIQDYLGVLLPPTFNPTTGASVIYVFDNGSIYAAILEFPSASDAGQFFVYVENYYASLENFNVRQETIAGFDNAFEGEGCLSSTYYHGYYFGTVGHKGKYLSAAATDENIRKPNAQSVITMIKPEPEVPSAGPSEGISLSAILLIIIVIVVVGLVALFLIRFKSRRKR